MNDSRRSLPKMAPWTFMIAAFALAACPDSASAQDAHHWTIQYGPRAGLLGGAVIGSAEDISASFYNPGALALAADLPFALSTQVFEAKTLTLENGAGDGLDLNDTTSGLVPSLIAGQLKLGFMGKNVVTYSILTRFKSASEVILPVVLDRDSLPEDSGVDNLLALFRFDSLFSEHWGGLSVARPLGERFGIGASGYLSYRSHRRRDETISQGVTDRVLATSSLSAGGFEFNTLRGFLKVGSYAKFERVSLGATITTPSLRLAGSGRASLLLTELDGTAADNVAAADVQEGLRAEYRSPLSIGFGGAVTLGRARLHASGEWFDSKTLYSVMTPDPVEPATGGEPLPFEVTHALKSVTNFAAGLEVDLPGSARGYASFYSDRSAAVPEVDPDIALATYNIKVASLGADFEVGKPENRRRVTLGASFGWGNQRANRLTDLVGEGDTQLRYKSIRFLLGFRN